MPNQAIALSEDTPYSDWLELGQNLASQKRNLDWLIGDWINFGRQRFPEQIELALTSAGIEPTQVKRIEKTVKAFPPHLRSEKLSFDHHAHLADLPTQEALPMLKTAEQQNIDARALRIEAMLRKVEIGQILPREDDAEDDALLACVRAWNRAPLNVRDDFSEMIRESNKGVIEFR